MSENNILFIDDEHEILKSYEKLFAEKKSKLIDFADNLFDEDEQDKNSFKYPDYKLYLARQGMEGITIIEEQLKKKDPIKVVFVDMRMPPGIDGGETTKRIKEIDPNVEVVIVTAYSDTKLDQIIRDVGRADKLLYLKKPFDPTEIKQFAFNLTEKYNQERIKENFLTNITHELKTPLSSIMGFSGLLMETDEVEGKTREYLEIIHRNSNLLKLLINDLILTSDINKHKLVLDKSPCSINEMLQHIYKSTSMALKKNPKINFSVEYLESDVEAIIDMSRVEQCLINLISNANKFTLEGEVSLKAKCHADELVFSVIDTGMGIPDDKKIVVFERFERLENQHHKIPGTGVGLFITKTIVLEHQGKIWIEDNKPQGSIFKISIPLLTGNEDEK